jgi:tetratricopeptide (TPR) repeat protein
MTRTSRAIVFGLCCLVPFNSFAQSSPQQTAAPDAFQRGLIALQANRFEDALKNFTEAENEDPQNAVIRNFCGVTLVRLGRNDQAAYEYRRAVQLNPQLEDAYKNLGFLEWTQRHLDPARDSLEQAIALSPSDSFAHYYLGRVYLDAQRYAAGLHELEFSRVILPADADFELQLTAAYLAVGRHDDALKVIERTSTARLDSSQSVRFAALLIQVQQNDRAVAAIEKITVRSELAADYWRQFDLALANLLAGNYVKAMAQARSANEALTAQDPPQPESAAAWTILAIAAVHVDQSERALNAFRHAAALEPANEECTLNLTRELMELSRYDEALTALRAALAANPKSYALHLRVGAAQLAAGHYAEAETVFRELVNAGDPLPTGYVGLAQVLLRTGRASEAIAELTAAQKNLGPTFLVSYFLGLACERDGKPEQAAAAFQQALSLNPANAEAHLSLGKTQLALRQLNDAIAQLQETLRLDPANDQAKRLLSKAYARAGDTKRATEFAQPVVVSRPTEVSKPIVDQQQVVGQQPIVTTQPTPNALPNGDSQPIANPQPTSTPENLLGDFFIPSWQFPPENASH